MVLLLRRVPLLHHCPCSERLESRTASVVGDGVWAMLAARRACALGIGLLSGGYAKRKLERAGAYRVYEDPTDLLRHIDEVAVVKERGRYRGLFCRDHPHYRKRAIEAECSRTERPSWASRLWDQLEDAR